MDTGGRLQAAALLDVGVSCIYYVGRDTDSSSSSSSSSSGGSNGSDGGATFGAPCLFCVGCQDSSVRLYRIVSGLRRRPSLDPGQGYSKGSVMGMELVWARRSDQQGVSGITCMTAMTAYVSNHIPSSNQNLINIPLLVTGLSNGSIVLWMATGATSRTAKSSSAGERRQRKSEEKLAI